MKFKSLTTLFFMVITSCAHRDVENKPLSQQFKDYWYAGKAEITSYKLHQVRYGEIHEGTAVMIFVTEDFSIEKQVKLDDPSSSTSDKINVLKLNYSKKFNTGIYPYSMMLSVFSPVQIPANPRPLKITMSAQEWCGQVFTQLNLKDDSYQVQQYSYFESEGDKIFYLDADIFTEDELWNRIRLDYKSLPTGKIKIIPGLLSARLLHQDINVINAKTTLDKKEEIFIYQLEYPNGNSISIRFQEEFPHRIEGWEEKVRIASGEFLTTKAERIKSLITDYWTKNKNQHLYLRDTLGLN